MDQEVRTTSGKQMVSVEITIRCGHRHCADSGKVTWGPDMKERKHLITSDKIDDAEIVRSVHDIMTRIRGDESE